MTAMFPDSGVPPQDAKNSLLDPNTVNCNELWYSTSRCQPRFDPAAANAVLSELINLINKGEVIYDCSFLDQVQLATRYLIQRGLPRGLKMKVGPLEYTAVLDPPLTRYNDFLTLSVVPETTNSTGLVRLNIDAKGPVPIYRNDGLNLVAGDLQLNRPAVLCYYGGAFFVVGMVASQMPKPLSATMDLWVNQAFGKDTNNGLANTPEQALLTIQRAIDIAFSYQPGPYPININVMAGTYAPGITPNYSGPSLNLIGQGQATMIDAGASAICFGVGGPNNATVRNISIRNSGTAASVGALSCSGGASLSVTKIFAYGVGGAVVQASAGSVTIGEMVFYGSAYALWRANFNGSILFYSASICSAAAAINVTIASGWAGAGVMGVDSSTPAFGNPGYVSGPKYNCSMNGVVNDQSATKPWFPGSVAGSTSYGGQYV